VIFLCFARLTNNGDSPEASIVAYMAVAVASREKLPRLGKPCLRLDPQPSLLSELTHYCFLFSLSALHATTWEVKICAQTVVHGHTGDLGPFCSDPKNRVAWFTAR